MALWMIRAGRSGDRESYALEHGLAIIGWDNLGDLSKFATKEELREAYALQSGEASVARVSNHLGQLYAFSKRVEVGDLVALPLKRRSGIAFGVVNRAYFYDGSAPPATRHRIGVDWKVLDYPRSKLDQDLLFSLGAIMTVCKIKRNRAEERVRSIISGKAPPVTPNVLSSLETESEGVEDQPLDVANLLQLASDQIREFMSRKFTGHKLAELITAILQAQGYKAEASDPGADGGIDIVAGRGPLGFDPPRLVVQVKGGDAQQDVKVIRELRGVMTDLGVEHGLFVAWGGFKQSVKRESRDRFFEIRLWDAEDVIKAVQQHYDQLPEAIKAELPLQRIWTLVIDEEE